MEKIKAFCVKYGALILIFIMCLMLRGCIDLYNRDRQGASQSAPVDTAQATATPMPDDASLEDDYVSGVPGIVCSHDGALQLEQALSEDAAGARIVNISIFNRKNGLEVAAFSAGPAMSYGGVRWDADSYDVWVNDLDAGPYLMRYDNGAWVEERYAQPTQDIAAMAP